MEKFNFKNFRKNQDNVAEDLKNAGQISNLETKLEQESEKDLEIFNEWEKEFDSFLQQINSLPEDQKEEFITINENKLTHQLQVVKLIPWELYLELSRTSKELRRTAEDLP